MTNKLPDLIHARSTGRAQNLVHIFITILLIDQVFSWIGFVSSTKRAPFPVGNEINEFAAIAVGIGLLIVVCRTRVMTLIMPLVLVNSFSVLIVDFSATYWGYGSVSNFSVNLSHLDAIYFTLGTLTTAGTGNIAPVSEIARGIQTVQMVLDLGLLVFAVGLVVARLSDTTR